MFKTSPTRIQMRGSLITESLIDVILTNEPELFYDCGVYNPELSDHAIVLRFLREKVKSQQGKVIKFRSLKGFDAEKYKEDLIQAPWHVSEIFYTIDDTFTFVETLLSGIVNEYLPVKQMHVTPKDVPYMSKEWKKAVQAKRRAARKYIKERTRESWQAKRKARNEANRLRWKAIRGYWKDQSAKLKREPRTFMPFFSNKRQSENAELKLNIEGFVCRDQSRISSHLCNYLAAIADTIGDTLLSSQCSQY